MDGRVMWGGGGGGGRRARGCAIKVTLVYKQVQNRLEVSLSHLIHSQLGSFIL